MRVVGLMTILGSLLLCSSLRADPRGPRAGSPDGAAAPLAASPASRAPIKASLSDSASCAVAGTAVPDLDVQMSDAEGRPLARFGGVEVPLTLSGFPEKNDGRVRVVTNGVGRVHLEGYVSVRSIRLYLRQDVPVIAGHVSLLKGTAVEFVGLNGGQLRVAVKTADSLSETFHTSVPCDALTLEPPATGERRWAAPGYARGYLMRQQSVPLFDRPGAGARPVTLLHLASASRGLLFFGDRRERDFIHVLYHHDVAIDGWIAAKDLELLPRGELVDQAVSKLIAVRDKRLALRADGQLHRAPSDLPLYGRADHQSSPIGHVTKDTELYVLDVVVGWASVLPKPLDIIPIGDRQFWVRAKALGL